MPAEPKGEDAPLRSVGLGGVLRDIVDATGDTIWSREINNCTQEMYVRAIPAM